MADLTGEDVTNFTGGRLDGDSDEVQAMLKAALVTARRDAGWHVCPVLEDHTVTLDGPDSRMLWLPTRKLVELTSVDEDSTAVDLTSLRWSAGGPPGLLETPVRVRKKSRGYWTCNYQGVEVVMTHGYTEDEAADWRRAILSIVDQMALVPVSEGTGVSEFGLTRKQIDDVAYSYGPMSSYASMAEDSLLSMSHIFCDYRLPPVEFV